MLPETGCMIDEPSSEGGTAGGSRKEWGVLLGGSSFHFGGTALHFGGVQSPMETEIPFRRSQEPGRRILARAPPFSTTLISTTLRCSRRKTRAPTIAHMVGTFFIGAPTGQSARHPARRVTHHDAGQDLRIERHARPCPWHLDPTPITSAEAPQGLFGWAA